MTTSGWAFQPTSVTASSVSGYFMCHVHIDTAQDPEHHAASVAALARRYEADPKKAAALARARQKLAERLGNEPKASLTQLRLKAGLSQAKLAEKMGVQQPYIARVERGEDDLKLSTIENLARALGITPTEVFAAIAATRSSRGTLSNG